MVVVTRLLELDGLAELTGLVLGLVSVEAGDALFGEDELDWLDVVDGVDVKMSIDEESCEDIACKEVVLDDDEDDDDVGNWSNADEEVVLLLIDVLGARTDKLEEVGAVTELELIEDTLGELPCELLEVLLEVLLDKSEVVDCELGEELEGRVVVDDRREDVELDPEEMRWVEDLEMDGVELDGMAVSEGIRDGFTVAVSCTLALHA